MAVSTRPASVVYTDASRVDVGELSGVVLDLEVGDSDDFQLECPTSYPIAGGSLVYVDGTSFGGIVDHRCPTTGSPTASYRGRTWAGVLAERIVAPPAGQDYYEFDCDANELLGTLVASLGLDWLFEVPPGESGVRLSGRFDRYTDLWSGIRTAARASGARPSVTWGGTRATITVVPRSTVEADPSEAPATVDEPWRAINHLVCLGKGELRERTVVHLYADEHGNVSQTQTLFGADLREAVYDYSSAERDELVEDGTKKLQELQERSSVTVDSSGLGDGVELGDLVSAYDDDTGASVTAEVVRIVARVENGQLEVTCEAGASAISSGVAMEASGEVGAGVAYSAGDGISIEGGRISAEVTQPELDALAGLVDQKASGVTGASPIEVARSGTTYSVAHAASGVSAGTYGAQGSLSPTFGETLRLHSATFDACGHTTEAEDLDVVLPAMQSLSNLEIDAICTL